eukprot:GHVN01015194.1.p1 GENE.GHVN01015194.1~~GHVN01015194.1.p1  ORF type:complete len:122 (-),score=4.45 GHVN01015194.1:305-670(-)
MAPTSPSCTNKRHWRRSQTEGHRLDGYILQPPKIILAISSPPLPTTYHGYVHPCSCAVLLHSPHFALVFVWQPVSLEAAIQLAFLNVHGQQTYQVTSHSHHHSRHQTLRFCSPAPESDGVS